MAWTTPRTWVAGETVTAALLNTHLRDNLNALTTLTSFTPTWGNTGTANTLGNGTLSGGYITANDLVFFQILLAWGSTTASGSGNWTFTVPITSTSFGAHLAEVLYFDSSASANYRGVGINVSTTVIQPVTNASPVAAITSTSPFTWAQSDSLSISGFYFAA